MALKLLLCGAMGRMGEAIAAIAPECDAEVVHAVDQDDDPATGMQGCDVVIDFSYHKVTAGLVELAALHDKPVIIGTTGHTDEDRGRIIECGNAIPVVWSGNYSIGVNLLFYLTQRAAEILGAGYHAEVLEMHHCHKKDAPSGTALNLVDAIRRADGFRDASTVNGRVGDTGERPSAEIGVHAIRGGEIVGEHTAFFIGPNDRIELSHRASDRGIFARGALRAAHWSVGQPPGIYHMRDVLGLNH